MKKDIEDDEASIQSSSAPPTRSHDGVDHQEVSSGEMSKWNEMIDMGIAQYIRAHPDRFYRRVRRGIPERVRWQVWKTAVRLQDYDLPTKDYHDLSTRENKWTSLIEVDVGRTFPELKAFDTSLQQSLHRVLNAYASYNPAVGYCQGMNFIAGLLLLVSEQNEEESFAVFVCLMDNPDYAISGFYRGKLPLLQRYLHACDSLVAETVPELRDHFLRENVQAAVYLHQWFLTLFINCFPLSMVMIIWDVIVCEGLPVILRISVSILQVLKDSLLSMHLEEIIKFFKMMKTYDDEDGELNAFRIGQLLMKHTEHVKIPDRTLEYLRREPLGDDEGTFYSDDGSWDADNGGTWLQSLSRMFSFGSTRRRNTSASGAAVGNSPATHRAVSAPELASPGLASSSSAGYPGGNASTLPSQSMQNPSRNSSLDSASGASGHGGSLGDAGGDAMRMPQQEHAVGSSGASNIHSSSQSARHGASGSSGSANTTNAGVMMSADEDFSSKAGWEFL